IYWALIAAALRTEFEYRANVLVQILFGLLYQGTGFIFIWVVLSRFKSLAGWTLGDVTFLYGLRLTAHAVWVVPLNRLIFLDATVREGDFDRYLVRPLNPLLQFLTGRIRISALGDLLGGLLILTVAARQARIDWSPPAVAFLALSLVGGGLVEGSIQM